MTAPDCLDGPAGCDDTQVQYRLGVWGAGRCFPRCEAHWEAHAEAQQAIAHAYPDSPIAPAWFDAAAAGEHWDDD